MRALKWARKLIGGGASDKTVRLMPLADYSRDLIDELSSDHHSLLQQYDDIERATREGRYASVPAKLAAFRTDFARHVRNEDFQLYGYLTQHLRRSPATFARVQDFHGEMHSLTRKVAGLIKKYRMAGVRPANGSQFMLELREVGDLLREAVAREEREVYPLYRPAGP